MKDSRIEERKKGFKNGINTFNCLEDLGSIMKRREEFANRLRKNRKQEVLYKKRLEVIKDSFNYSDESIKRLTECDAIFSDPSISLVLLNFHS